MSEKRTIDDASHEEWEAENKRQADSRSARAMPEQVETSGVAAVAAGSAFSRTPLRVKKGKWVYRNFPVVTKGWRWQILSACGDAHPAKSLADARKQIDAWYAEGSVEQ